MYKFDSGVRSWCWIWPSRYKSIMFDKLLQLSRMFCFILWRISPLYVLFVAITLVSFSYLLSHSPICALISRQGGRQIILSSWNIHDRGLLSFARVTTGLARGLRWNRRLFPKRCLMLLFLFLNIGIILYVLHLVPLRLLLIICN